jgi:diguanylate cyclase (GGDEF)-like protein/PAS domain S-box-containing protein
VGYGADGNRGVGFFGDAAHLSTSPQCTTAPHRHDLATAGPAAGETIGGHAREDREDRERSFFNNPPEPVHCFLRQRYPGGLVSDSVELQLFASLAVAGALGVVLLFVWSRRIRSDKHHTAQLREREERLKLALWASSEQYWDYDLKTRHMRRIWVDSRSNRANLQVMSTTDSDHRIHPDDLPDVEAKLRAHLRGEAELFISEHRILDPRGEWLWVRARGRAVENGADGKVRRIAGTARDVTQVRQAERERRIAIAVLRSMNEAVAVLDRDFNFISINPAFTRTTGYSEREVIGQSASLLDSTQHDVAFYGRIRQKLSTEGHWAGEMWQRRKNGQEFLCSIESSATEGIYGEHRLYIAVITDITQQKRAEQELRYLANFDTLTNLPNRAMLSERLSRAIVRARRQNHRIAVLFLDLDRFKDINDSLGHTAGDRILRAAAMRLQETVGEHQTVARLGGDEFTVVLENLDQPADADDIALAIITAFEAPLVLDDRQEVVISPSIGISLYPDHGQVPTELLKQADTAMYQAKAAGRRTYVRYDDSMEIANRRRAQLSSALHKVLDRGELRLVFQPRLSLTTRRITGVEALLRWTSEEYGEIPPIQFIPLAEESGLILEIGAWVLRDACRTLQRWREAGMTDLGMAVNVSVLQLLRGDFSEIVRKVLDETGLPPHALELELTESVLMANAEQTAAKLQALREMGVSLAIDDFGTGYSSLAYLKRLPITTLKIDKTFITDLNRDPDDTAITTTVITMAHSLGLTVVAEGVETETQLRFLDHFRCDEIQGHWLSRPVDPEACLRFIRDWNPAAIGAGMPGGPGPALPGGDRA